MSDMEEKQHLAGMHWITWVRDNVLLMVLLYSYIFSILAVEINQVLLNIDHELAPLLDFSFCSYNGHGQIILNHL